MSNVFTANRLAAVGGFLTSLAGAALAVTNTLPHTWQATAVTIVGIVGSVGTALHFMSGSQKWDQVQAAPSAVPEELDSQAWLANRTPAPEPAPAPAPAPEPATTTVPVAPAPAPSPAPAPPDGLTQ